MRLRRLLAPIASLVLVCVALGARPARADDFMKSSPGPLAQSHAEIDGQQNCTQCHTDGKALSNDKCLGCHDHADQKAKMATGRGLHASAKVSGKKCWDCHLDHKGKNFDLMGWTTLGGTETFRSSHDTLTDFKLGGKHATVACEKCHTRKDKQGLRLFLGESKLCGSCHKDDQPHNFTRQEMMKCDRCHSEIAWKPAKKVLDFDHDDKAQAAFPLEGSHAEVACAKCHPKAEFNLKKDTTQCSACHPNVHEGSLYGKIACDKCHSARFKSLADFRFDHDRETKFKLDGAHTKTACIACHPKKQVNKPSRACEACHARDDKHNDRFVEFGKPEPCALCHPTASWKDEAGEPFDHDHKTKFKLTGKHITAGCRDCHRGKGPAEFERFDPKTVGCMGCHQHTNVHKKEFSDKDCLGCHKMAGVNEGTEVSRNNFHGPDSKFPLVLGHAKVPCALCHKNDKWKISPQCGDSCHEDSLHKGTLGKDCARCHSGGTWKATRFDHDEDSKYPLLGNHKTATCEGCHAKRRYKPTPTSCGDVACHLNDDAHKLRLGKACEKCHKETGENIFQHNVQAEFKLRDSHLKVACKNCHPTLEFKPRPKDCFGCHPEPTVHKGMYGTKCDSCHNEIGWQQIKPIHDVGNFSLKGAHDKVPCARCHKVEQRPLAGTGNLCITCHREDDIHGNSLGPKCGECHTQNAFAPARFDHTTVGCDLQAQHRVLPCADCHKAGAFGALNDQCASCHWNDAATRPTHKDNPGTYSACGACHKLTSWNPGAIGGGSGQSSVCRQ
jgi:hypothetical protein